MRYVQTYFTTSPAGMGMRRVFVSEIATNHWRFFFWQSLEAYWVSNQQFGRVWDVPPDVNYILRRLAELERSFAEAGLPISYADLETFRAWLYPRIVARERARVPVPA